MSKIYDVIVLGAGPQALPPVFIPGVPDSLPL